MFTQCSTCETVFRLSADALRAAGGQVRCGRCGEVFNALARLAEDSTGFTKGDSSLEQESRADAILEADASLSIDDPDDADAADGVAMARLEFLEPLDELTAETSLEFTLPPNELDRIFIETQAHSLQQLATNGPRGERATVVHLHPEATTPPPPVPLAAHPEMAGVPAMPVPPVMPFPPSVLSAPAAPGAPAAPVLAVVPARPFVPAAPVAPRAPIATSPDVATPPSAASALELPLARVTGLEVSEDARQAMLSSFAHSKLPQMNERRRTLPFAVWLGAAIVFGLLLVLQIVRHNGNWMTAHSLLLGGAASNISLSSYQLRQWGVTGDPAAKGTLRVRASIMNTAAQLQPYPLLRVSLVNRFGSRVGAREFEPADYLGKPVTRMLAPGERTDATLDILDPGKDAEGFELDVCVRGADKAVACAGDAAAQGK